MSVDGKVQCVCVGKFPLWGETATIDLEQLAKDGRCPDLVKTGNGGYAIFYHIPEISDGQEIAMPRGAIEIPKGVKSATYSRYRTKYGLPFYEDIEWRFN